MGIWKSMEQKTVNGQLEKQELEKQGTGNGKRNLCKKLHGERRLRTQGYIFFTNRTRKFYSRVEPQNEFGREHNIQLSSLIVKYLFSFS